MNLDLLAPDAAARGAGCDLHAVRSSWRPSRRQDARAGVGLVALLAWLLAAPGLAQTPIAWRELAGATATAVGVLFGEGLDDDPAGRSGLAAVTAAARLERGHRGGAPLLASGVKVGADYALVFCVVGADQHDRAAAFVDAVRSGGAELTDDALEILIARAALAADDAEFLYPGDVLMTRARRSLADEAARARPPFGYASECSELRPSDIRRHLKTATPQRVAVLGAASAAWRASFGALDLVSSPCPPRGGAVFTAPSTAPTVTQDLSERADSPYVGAAFPAPPAARRAAFALGLEVAKARAFRSMKLRGRELFARAPFVRWSWLEAEPIVMFYRRGEDPVALLPGQRRRASVADEVAATRRELEALLADLRGRLPSGAELAAARARLLSSVALPGRGERADWVTEPATYPGRLQAMLLAAHHGVDAAALSSATAADVAQVLGAALAPANASWHVVAPRERARFGFRRR